MILPFAGRFCEEVGFAAGASGPELDETYDLGTPITRMLYLESDMGA